MSYFIGKAFNTTCPQDMVSKVLMKIEAGKLYAVITGDIVDSSKLPPEKRQQLHKVMKEGSNALRKAFKKDVSMNDLRDVHL